MIKNSLLTFFSILFTLAFIEFVVGNLWLKSHSDNRPDKFSKEFYKKYYNKLHHLREFRDDKYKHGLMYTIIDEKLDYNNFKSTVLINGDSWAEFFLEDEVVLNEIKKIKREEKINLVLSGTVSYSFSPTTVQLQILREDFNINPNMIITMIDHTDVGDEICRYKNQLEFDEHRNLLRVRPENIYSAEVFAIQLHLARYDIYDSKDLNIVKILKYESLLNKIKKNRKPMKCNFTEIMKPLKEGLSKSEYIYLKEVTLRYINTVFKDKRVEKLLLVVHPHLKHFTGQYTFYFGNFLKEILKESIYNNKIKVLDFKEVFQEVYFNNDTFKKYQDVYLVGDPASHINVPARILFIKKAINKLLY